MLIWVEQPRRYSHQEYRAIYKTGILPTTRSSLNIAPATLSIRWAFTTSPPCPSAQSRSPDAFCNHSPHATSKKIWRYWRSTSSRSSSWHQDLTSLGLLDESQSPCIYGNHWLLYWRELAISRSTTRIRASSRYTYGGEFSWCSGGCLKEARYLRQNFSHHNWQCQQ